MTTLLTMRKSLDEICKVPDKIISVYSLEQHVWRDNNAAEARTARQPELQTIEEFQIGPVRPFLNDIMRLMAAPYRADRRGEPIGQGYWIQAEFGSGKSHLLCFLSALTVGGSEAWELVREKEAKAERGRRESLYRFWEDGLEAKSSDGSKGIFVIVKTLVGAGGSTVGLDDQGRRLVDYILDAAKEQIALELGKNLSLYPAELLADRFLKEDMGRYRADLKKFLRDPRYFDEDEVEDVDDFIAVIQQDRSPEYKRSAGNKLWRFYTDYLKVTPQIAADTEEILKHLVETILAEGYAGVLLVLDEVSLFMKNRNESLRSDDEQTLVVLSNRLAKVHNLPLWTVCSAQQAIESKMGVRNIIADDRLKLVKLLEGDTDYYEIVLSRVREIVDPGAITNYYLHYKRGFTWPNAIGEAEFARFFPFHQPALEVVRAITYELTTARSAIHFMHQTLKHQIKQQGQEIIRLWELFDEAVRYEEDPSGVHAGLVAIQTKREADYRAYEACKNQINGVTKGSLKIHRDKAIKTVQTLFLYHVARTRQQGLTPEDIANSVLIERAPDADPEENIEHYETLADNLRKELRQVVQSFDEENTARYRFEPVVAGIDPRQEFGKARDEVEANEQLRREAWEALLALESWPIRTRQMTIDLANGARSLFRAIAPTRGQAPAAGGVPLEVTWQGRQVAGLVQMQSIAEHTQLPRIESDQTDRDFAVVIGMRPIATEVVARLLAGAHDPRLLIWSPGALTADEEGRLRDFAAYRKLVADWQGKDSEDAVAVINWVSATLQTEMGRIAKIVDDSYARGRIDALNNSQLDFRVAGDLAAILAPLVDRVLSAAYESREIRFEPPFIFRKEEAVKVINGIVRTGEIPKGAKPTGDISAAQNFGVGLKIIKKSAEKKLDTSDNPYVRDLWGFIDDKLGEDGGRMPVETLYKNFMGTGGPKDYGLSRRMVQLYLLCLVQQGKVRVGLGARSGLSITSLDYATIKEMEFSAKVLDALLDVQKMARPENWGVLRPYAEKLLGELIADTHDDAAIAGYRNKLRELFATERDRANRLVTRAAALFAALQQPNPYAAEAESIERLFAHELSGGDDIALVLYALKEALSYRAYDEERSDEQEVDDLANRLRNYRDLERFVGYDTELRAAHAYCAEPFPDHRDLQDVRRIQEGLTRKLADLQPYIDSEVRLKTELIGHTPPDADDGETLAALIHGYTTVYAAMHDAVVDAVDRCRGTLQERANGDELRALAMLEEISALQPPIAEEVARKVLGLDGHMFRCANASRTSIEQQLRTGPLHDCGLSFNEAEAYVRGAQQLAEMSKATVTESIDGKLEVFASPAVRARLEQGAGEPLIRGLLLTHTPEECRAYLVRACLDGEPIVESINRYLKRIVVKRLRIADFKPSISTIERDGVADLALEFQAFLEAGLAALETDGDTLPMLQLE